MPMFARDSIALALNVPGVAASRLDLRFCAAVFSTCATTASTAADNASFMDIPPSSTTIHTSTMHIKIMGGIYMGIYIFVSRDTFWAMCSYGCSTAQHMRLPYA